MKQLMVSLFIPVFKLPATVILVDDDKQFLQNFGHILGKRHRVKSYSDAQAAIEYLNAQEPFCKAIVKALKKIDAMEMDDDSAYTVFAYEKLLDILYKPNRFDNASVVLVDYLMPNQITGIQFCEKIRNLPARKIMLTGKADSNIAVDAFNHNVINKFIVKDPKDIEKQVCIAIEEETDKYFGELSSLVAGWKIQQQNVVSKYASVFFKVIEDYGIVEYYQVGDSAYVMLDKDANVYWLVFQNQENLNESLLLGKDNHASKNVLSKLENNSHLLFLFSEEEKRLSVDAWGKFIFPVLGKADDYFYTVIKNEWFSLDRNKIKSYKDYMETQV